MPAALQSTSLRLLYNLIETIFQRRADVHTSEMYRGLLSSILECFVRKLGSLRAQVTQFAGYVLHAKFVDCFNWARLCVTL
jgi:hypothetical protein